ncbi:MAG: hypothetical protein ACQEQU_09590 [Spirochaetota bacterium]
MVSVRSQYVLQVSDPRSPRLVISPLKRLLFGGIALLLAAALCSGAAAAETIELSPGLLFFITLLLVSVAIAAYGKSWVFLLDTQKLERRWSLFGLVLYRQQYPLAALSRIQVEQVRLLSEAGRPQGGSSFSAKGSYFERRKYYFKLVLMFTDQRMVVDDGTDGAHMKLLAQGLSAAVGVGWTSLEV